MVKRKRSLKKISTGDIFSSVKVSKSTKKIVSSKKEFLFPAYITILDTTYRFNKKLGMGSYGIVGLYSQPNSLINFFTKESNSDNLPKEVVVKLFTDPEQYNNERNNYKIFHSDKKLSGVIGKYYGSFTVQSKQSYYGIIIEKFESDLLDREISKNLTFNEAFDYCSQIANILSRVHAKKICINDLKTENIMIDSNNKLRLIDLCLSGDYLGSNSHFCYTPNFIPPKLIQDQIMCLPNDIWSFGIICFSFFLQRQWPTVDVDSSRSQSFSETGFSYSPEEIKTLVDKSTHFEPHKSWVLTLLIGKNGKSGILHPDNNKRWDIRTTLKHFKRYKGVAYKSKLD